jgi:hypothetical protein
MKNLWEKVGPIMGGLITNPKVARIKNPKKSDSLLRLPQEK